MGNSQSFDDETTYGKDSLFAETEDSSMIAHDNDTKGHRLLKSKKHTMSRLPATPEASQNRSQTNCDRTNYRHRGEQIIAECRDSAPDDLSDRDELSAMTDMAWKHLSNQIRSSSAEVIDAEEEFSLRQSRDGDDDEREPEARSPMSSSLRRDKGCNNSAPEQSKSFNTKKTHQSGDWGKKLEQDKYSVHTYSAEETSYSKEAMREPPASPESFFGGIRRNDSPPSTKSDHSPVHFPRFPVSPSSHEMSLRMEYITSRLDAMTESLKSQSIQAAKTSEQDTIQGSLNSSLQRPQQRVEEWNMDTRLDELSKNQLVIDDPTGSLTGDTIQETIIHDDEIQIESDSVIEVQNIDRNIASFQPETIENESPPSLAPIKSDDRTLVIETSPVDQVKSNDTQHHGALVLDTSFNTKSIAQKPENDATVKMEDAAEELDNIVPVNADSIVLSRNTAVSVLASPRMLTDSADLLITEDFLDKCGNFVTNLVENPLTSPCSPSLIPASDSRTAGDQNDSDMSSKHANRTPIGHFPNKEADAFKAKPGNINDQQELSEPGDSSDLQSILSDELDIEFIQKYANLFEAFLTENLDLMDQNPDMISFLYVAKLTKIMESSEKLESAFKKRITKLRSDKESVLSLYREDLIETAKEKVIKGIQHEQDLKVLQEASRVMEGKQKWNLLMKNASRAQDESTLLKTLWKTTMDADTPLEYLPASHETQVIREAAAPCPTEVIESHDVLLKDLRRFQIENNFLNAEISVLEGKLNQRKHTANTHLWVDSVFRRLGTKPKKIMKD